MDEPYQVFGPGETVSLGPRVTVRCDAIEAWVFMPGTPRHEMRLQNRLEEIPEIFMANPPSTPEKGGCEDSKYLLPVIEGEVPRG